MVLLSTGALLLLLLIGGVGGIRAADRPVEIGAYTVMGPSCPRTFLHEIGRTGQREYWYGNRKIGREIRAWLAGDPTYEGPLVFTSPSDPPEKGTFVTGARVWDAAGVTVLRR
jgi:hypothetical protein